MRSQVQVIQVVPMVYAFSFIPNIRNFMHITAYEDYFSFLNIWMYLAEVLTAWSEK